MSQASYFEHPSTGCRVLYSTIRRAMKKECPNGKYHMSLTSQDEIRAVIDVVNVGIDSHLEACNIPALGDKYATGERKAGDKVLCYSLDCEVSAESLPTLLRRLTEIDFDDSNEAGSLVSDVLTTLGIDDYGKYVGCEALGV